MNSTERFMATIQGEKVDRRAMVLTLSLYGAKLIGSSLREYYTNPATYAEGQLAVREEFCPDVLFTPFALPLLGGAFGSEVQIFDNQPPNMIRPVIGNADQFFDLPLPDVDSNPGLVYIRESLTRMVSDSKGEWPVAAIALSPVDLPVLIMGIDNWLETMLFAPDKAARLLERINIHFQQWTDALFADGASCVVLPIPFANLRIVTRKIASETVLPALTNSFDQVKGPLILHHVGGPFLNSLPFLSGLPNVIGYCVGQEDNLAESRDAIGPDSVLLGNIDGPGLLRREAESIYEQTVLILKERASDPHFVLTTSAADIDMETPPENIQAIRKAVESQSSEV